MVKERLVWFDVGDTWRRSRNTGSRTSSCSPEYCQVLTVKLYLYFASKFNSFARKKYTINIFENAPIYIEKSAKTCEYLKMAAFRATVKR